MGYKYHIQDVLDVAPSISELLASERGISIKTGQGCKCPLHNDTNPSFHLYEDTQRGQTFACFGCHRGGDVITFWQLSLVKTHPSLTEAGAKGLMERIDLLFDNRR